MSDRSRVIAAGFVVWFATFALFAPFVPDAFSNGDAVDYQTRIAHRALDTITIHRGYFLLGIAFTSVWPSPHGITDRELNFLSTVCGATSAVLAFAIAHALTRRIVPSLAAAAVLVVIPEFAEDAIFTEVYGPQVTCFLVAILFLVRGIAGGRERPIAASVALGAATLVTPSTVLSGPALLWLTRSVKTVLVIAGVTGAIIAASVVPSFHDWLLGDRGLMTAAGRSLTLVERIWKEKTEIDGARAFLPFVLLALWRARSSVAVRRFVLMVATLWVVTFFIGERFGDVPAQLPTWALLAVVAAVGLDQALDLARGRKIAVAAVLALFLLALAWAGRGMILDLEQKERRATKYRDLIELAAARATPDAAAYGRWSRCVLFDHYLGRPRSSTAFFEDRQLSGEMDADTTAAAWTRFRAALDAGRQIWLVSPPDPVVAVALDRAGYVTTPFGAVFVAERPHR